jgi:hypothetical protein
MIKTFHFNKNNRNNSCLFLVDFNKSKTHFNKIKKMCFGKLGKSKRIYRWTLK